MSDAASTGNQEFIKASEDIRKIPESSPLSNDELLKLYALFKQATVGDNNTSKPTMFDLKGRYKWEQWNQQKGKSKEDAQKEYISYVKELLMARNVVQD